MEMAQTLLLCIGAQKAGTTWLADYLRDHPQVHIPLTKEVHFFDAKYVPKWCRKYETEILEEFQSDVASLSHETCGDPAVQQKLHAMLLRFRMIHDPQEYLRFMTWGAQGRSLLFEATPDYCMLGEDGFRAMEQIHPDVRLVFLLRNPADRFWSSMKFNKTHRPEFDIEQSFNKFLTREDFMLLADYGRTIRAVKSVFPAEKLHIEFYEQLFDDAAVERICGFAGISPKKAIFSEKSNASIQGTMPPDFRMRAIEAYAHVYRDIHEIMGGNLPANWTSDLASL